ncbi:MAG: glutaminyl-peptide cyclotransferase [Gemmatimonadota bacterium]|nr:MAG: glutaminyl-peptide cyclotransferase [Gemmatimonadota bacterium]
MSRSVEQGRSPGVSLAVLALASACSINSGQPQYDIVSQFPHDTSAYTQGLVYSAGRIYESTGRLGLSQLRQLDATTGILEASVALPTDRFGEGLALLEGKLYQLTWKSGVGYVYDATTLVLQDSFNYSGEGWGLATDGTSLIVSDGTSNLRVLDPQTFQVTREVTVTDDGLPLSQINELEYIGGELYANIYQSDWIVRISPVTGEVLAWIDLAGILPADQRTAATDVLNGIAFNKDTGHLFVTGKLWPWMFEIRLHGLPN